MCVRACVLEIQYNSVHPDSYTLEILLLWQLKKIFQNTEVSALIISSTHSDSMVLCCIIWTLLGPSSYFYDFQRSQEEYTRWCWQEEACNTEADPDATK